MNASTLPHNPPPKPAARTVCSPRWNACRYCNTISSNLVVYRESFIVLPSLNAYLSQ
ncbi:hypothetical protein B0T12DRAFT_425999 [Alternaria alternata]|nr:hypothetical protein B0T12DRAFT_425999 [Alternaria alternata]